MFISDFAIKKPIVTVAVMIALVAFGIFSLLKLEVDEFPEIEAPIVFVGVPYPGASPDQVEREVIDRMEEAFSGLSGVDRITSTASDGFAQIIVKFVYSKDIDQASQDIRDGISSIRNDLPPEMEEPVIQRFDPNAQPIVSLTVSSNRLTPAQLTELADPGIVGDLRGVSGVAEVTVVGGHYAELTVNVRPADLQAAGLSVSQVAQALQAQSLAAPVGRVNAELSETSIRLQGRLQNPAQFEQLVVGQQNGQLIRLGQVADVSAGTEEPRSTALFKGVPAVGIDITKQTNASTTTVANGIKDEVARIQQRLPPGTKLDVVRDAGERVEHSVTNVEEALLEGAALTVLVVFLFLNSWRSTVITGLALPVSVLSSFIAVLAFGFSLNTMSLMGLSLAIGILIDDAIVVRENIVRHIEMGEDHTTASHTGTDEIGLAVTATTLSIVAVFVPVGFMSGIAGQWFKPFALTIACAVLVSLFVSFSLDPMLSAYWADPQVEEGEHRNPISRALERFNDWFDGLADRYKGVIGWALDHRWTVVALAALSFVGAIVLQATIGGAGFIPESDRSELAISLETPPGSSLDYTRLKAEEVSRIARAHPQVRYTYTSIGSASGSGAVDEGSVYVRLAPKSERDVSQAALSEQIRQQVRRVAGVTAYISEAGGPNGGQKQLQVQVRGSNQTGQDELTRVAQQIEAQVEQVPGAVDVGLSTRGEKPEFDVDIDRGLAGALGVTVGQVAQSLRPAFAGIDAGDWIDPSGQTRDVRIRLAPEARVNLSDLAGLPLVVGGVTGGDGAGATGAPAGPTTIPLGQVATIRRSLAPAQIQHLDRDRVITVGANTQGRSLSEVTGDVNARIAALDLPPGIRISQGGEVESQGEVFGSIFAALGLAVMLMYLILVVQFGSFLDPVAILVSLPLSLIGVVLALIITGDTLNLMSLIGVMLLMGIVAKNAILLVDFAKWNREKGMELREALIEAGRVRLRPIIMTTLALIAGMIPVAIGAGEGADFRAPLGRAVIGGVITSTLLTLLVIPTVYEIFDGWRTALATRFARRRESQPSRERSRSGLGGAQPVPEAGD